MVPPQPYSGSPGWPPVTTILYLRAGLAVCAAALRVALAAARLIAFRISLRFISGGSVDFSVMVGVWERAGDLRVRGYTVADAGSCHREFCGGADDDGL